jgi:hypothetical protein
MKWKKEVEKDSNYEGGIKTVTNCDYFSGHTLLRNCPPEAKKQDALLRKAAYHSNFNLICNFFKSFGTTSTLILERYAYIQANVDFLALEQLEELKLTHPPIQVDEPDEDEGEQKEGEKKEGDGKDEAKEEKKEDEKKEEEYNDLGNLGHNAFGGGYPCEITLLLFLILLCYKVDTFIGCKMFFKRKFTGPSFFYLFFILYFFIFYLFKFYIYIFIFYLFKYLSLAPNCEWIGIFFPKIFLDSTRASSRNSRIFMAMRISINIMSVFPGWISIFVRYNSYGGFGGGSSFGGFGGGSSFGEDESGTSGGGGGGGGKDDWFDDFLGPASTPAPSSSFSTFSMGGPSFLGGASEPDAASEPKKKEPTKKYLFSTYPAIDATLMFHVVLQVLIEVYSLIF